MKRNVCLGLVLATVLCAVSSASVAHAEETCSKIVATGHPDYPVMAFREGDDIVGAAPLLISEIAEELKLPFDARYMGSWAEAQAATREGKADMIIGVYQNEERAKYLDYVEPPFAYDPVQVFVATDDPFAFAGQDDLIGRRGVANEGESFGETFDAFLKDQLTVRRVNGLRPAFDAVMSGDADYLIAGYYPVTAELARLKLEERIEPLEPELLSEELFVAFSKTSPCAALSSKFGKGITDMTEDGRFRELVRDALRDWDAQNPEE